MAFALRPYQVEAVTHNIDYFTQKKIYNALQIVPTGAGKSVIIANTAKELKGNTIVFQPSKEILAQNFQKFISYGYQASIYSASGGMKHIDKVTFATIGSVDKKAVLFKQFNNIIIDECHKVNAEQGMYKRFIESLGTTRVLGLTATPYRLYSGMEGAMLKFLTRTRPRIFNKVNYYIQNGVLFDQGHLAPLKYFDFKVIDRNKLETNASGTDFTDKSLREEYEKMNMNGKIIHWANRILAKRKNLLVFCSLVSDAYAISKGIPGSKVIHGGTPAEERDKILTQFKKGVITCVINCSVLDTGFDYPGLEAVLIGKSTMSLAVYYQIIGRVMRPFFYPDGTKKEGWVIDLGGNIGLFGQIETMMIEIDSSGRYFISNKINGVWRQLTNVTFSKS